MEETTETYSTATNTEITSDSNRREIEAFMEKYKKTFDSLATK